MQIAFVLYPGFTGLDALGPYEFLKMIPDADVRFLAHEKGPVPTDRGILTVEATHSFEETPSPDLLLIPGSEAETRTAMKDENLLNWLRTAHETTRWTTSVCSGSLVLAAAGLLKGHPATSHWIAQGLLEKFGAESRPHDRVVQSGKLWTAAGVSAGIDLALSLLLEICGRERTEIIQLLLEYDPHPPLTGGHPDKVSPDIFAKAKAEMLALAQPRSS